MTDFFKKLSTFRKQAPVLRPKFDVSCDFASRSAEQPQTKAVFCAKGEYQINVADLAIATGIVSACAGICALVSLFHQK